MPSGSPGCCCRLKRAIRGQGHSIEIGSVINLFQAINQRAPGQREAASVNIHFITAKFHPDWQLKIQLNAVPGLSRFAAQ